MSSLAFINPTIYLHDIDWAGFLKQIAMHPTVDEVPATPFQPPGGTVVRLPGGLVTIDWAAQGFWDSTPDLAAFSALGVADRVMSVCPEGVEAKTAYMLQTAELEYEPFGQIGQAAPFNLSGKNTNPQGLVQGQLAKAKGNVSGTGPLGSGVSLGLVGTGKFLYAAFHIFTAATTITVQLQSDDNAPFGSPTLRQTIGPLTVAGGTWMVRVPGPIATDTFFRFNVSAITGTFSVAGAIGIGS